VFRFVATTVESVGFEDDDIVVVAGIVAEAHVGDEEAVADRNVTIEEGVALSEVFCEMMILVGWVDVLEAVLADGVVQVHRETDCAEKHLQ
jgi:hypothetical protein